MDQKSINFETFELPFFIEKKDELSHNFSGDDNEEEEDNNLIKENMVSRIPDNAIYLGSIEGDHEHGTTSWIDSDEYYIMPLYNDVYSWAVFRISWDDNYGNWEWIPDGRIKGLETNLKTRLVQSLVSFGINGD